MQVVLACFELARHRCLLLLATLAAEAVEDRDGELHAYIVRRQRAAAVTLALALVREDADGGKALAVDRGELLPGSLRLELERLQILAGSRRRIECGGLVDVGGERQRCKRVGELHSAERQAERASEIDAGAVTLVSCDDELGASASELRASSRDVQRHSRARLELILRNTEQLGRERRIGDSRRVDCIGAQDGEIVVGRHARGDVRGVADVGGRGLDARARAPNTLARRQVEERLRDAYACVKDVQGTE